MEQARWKRRKLVVGLMVVLVLSVVVVLSGCAAARDGASYPEGPALTRSDRILIVAPHPDDESLAPAGVIRHAVEKKIPVKVVLMTTGDGYKRAVQVYYGIIDPTAEDFRRLAGVRHLESLNAMKELGLREGDVIFLAYPDGGTNSLFEVNWDYDNLHQSLNGGTSAPYPFAYELGAPYCGENVVKDLEKIVADFKPTMVLYPDPGDDHHDHWATGAFLEYVLARRNYQGKQVTYLVHKGFDWPTPWAYRPERELLPPSDLVRTDAKWTRFFLSKSEEVRKRKAIKRYVSQFDLMEPFLDAFVRRNELFATYPDIKIACVKAEPRFFSGDRLPHTVFQDARRDTLIRELEGFADVTSVGFALSKNNAWLALETRYDIPKDLVYAFHLRIFTKDGVKRVDIRVQGGKATSEILAKNSISAGEAISAESKDNRLVVKIPANLFENADRIILGVDTWSSEGRRIDRTAYRRIDF